MSLRQPEQTPESWDNALELFERLLEADDPEAVLAAEPDALVRETAGGLFRRHQAATAAGFMEESPTAVKALWQPEAQVFSDGMRLVNGRFEIKKMAGKGGMGEVYLARDHKLEADVALKTVRRSLASDPTILQQFVTEIQIARSVNHPNVCRIYDLFDDGANSLFSMEYLPGARLSERLAEGTLSPRERKQTALQLAEGLAALHAKGLIHRDFKPGNAIFDPAASAPALRAVIMDFGLAQRLAATGSSSMPLKAGTLKYMAPELSAASPATIRSDIFAFGKVLEELLPGDKWAARCQAENPLERPASLAPVIAHLKGHPTRRMWMTAAAASAAGATVSYWMFDRASLQFPSRQGLVLNGFHAPDRRLAETLKTLVVTALNQSMLLRLVPDDTLTATLAQLKLPKDLPAGRENLRAAASYRKIPYLAEGVITRAGANGLHLLVQLFERDADKPSLEVSETVSDQQQLVRLAERVAVHLRKGIGESSTAFAATHTDLEQATSSSPEAVDLLFRGIDLYEHSKTDEALLLFEKAIELDSQFALAHAQAGLAAAARYQVEQAVEHFTRAFGLKSRVPERERLWIERGFHNITGNFDEALAACRKLVAFYPDDATFRRNLAFGYARVGRPEDSLPINREAIELNPGSDANKCELVVNLVQADHPEDALKAAGQFRAMGTKSAQLHFGTGLAHLSLRQFDEASADFDRMRSDQKDERQALLFSCAPMILRGRFAEAKRALERDLSRDLETSELPYYKNVRQVWLACLHWFTDSAETGARLGDVLKLNPNPTLLQLFRETAVVGIQSGHLPVAEKALELVRGIANRWPSAHSKGSALHLEGAIHEARGDTDGCGLLNQASGLWGDPLTMAAVRDCYMKRKEWRAANAAAAKVESERGRIYKHYFPGWYTLNQIARGKIFEEMSLWEDALRQYRQVLWWDPEAETYQMFRGVRGEAGRITILQSRGERHG